jgi:hypothetical protein
MTPTKASPALKFTNDYSRQSLNRPQSQEKTTLVNLSEIKIPAERRIPRAAMYFPMSRAASRMSFSEWQNPRLNFKSLGDNAEILSEAGFSEEQISGILSGSGSHLSERVDRLAKFTQPKIDSYGEVICLLPSELEYVLRSGLSINHIADMLLGSGEDLSLNIEALKDFVTPWIECTNEQGISGIRSPLRILEEIGSSKDKIAFLMSKMSYLSLDIRVKKVLYLMHCTKNIVFKDLFKDSDSRMLGMFNTNGMTLEDAKDILEMFGAGEAAPASFFSGYPDDMVLDNFAEGLIEDNSYILDIFNSFAEKA